MVTCQLDTIAVPNKMNSVRSTRKLAASNAVATTNAGGGSSNSSGFRLLDADQLEANSSVSRNSVYKLKIDLMFDDTRSIRSNRLDDPRGSHRTRSIIMYGRSELASTAGDSSRSLTSFLQESNKTAEILANNTKKDVQRISNSVQAQIEQLFTDVAKDATSTFAVTCLGSLPLKDKVTSLQGLQEPLRELYLKELAKEQRNSGFLDICATGLRVKTNSNESPSTDLSNGNSTDISSNGNELNITPFHNIAVWSAVRFVVSEDEGRAAFLPLITDPENIDKASLYQPLSALDQQKIAKSKTHAPIFAVVMRSAGVPKVLECHAFICKSTEDAIVIAATLYQSLMAHVSSNSHRSTKRRTPRNQNGVSCISIASSSAVTGSNYLSRSQIVASGRKSSFRSSSGNSNIGGSSAPTRSSRKKRVSSSSLSSSSNVINEAVETTTEERKRKSHKTKRAPPIPALQQPPGPSLITAASMAGGNRGSQRSHHHVKKSADGGGYRTSAGNLLGNGGNVVVPANVPSSTAVGNAGNLGAGVGASLRSNDIMNGDILTRVAIPRSGSFLNTGGLTRYKSRAARSHSGKLGGGGGGGELFNEFRLHENLNSLDEILYAIIDADGMSFNDLKPIYKEFLLKLAVTLTKDELFQRSKNIMRRQKKKKLKRRANLTASPKKPRTLFFGAKNLKKVFQFGQFRACRGKPPKPPRNKDSTNSRRKSETPITIGPPTSSSSQHTHHQQQRSRIATSGSDVSVIRNENGFNGPHRNSSSGYVSCSECSYDSEACTCISADRCYCSLRNERNERNANKGRRKHPHATATKKSSSTRSRNESSNYTSGSIANRNSYISCKSEDKCYCSMVEEEPNIVAAADDDTSSQAHSDTTWCDTDSCLSASKCYCKRAERRNASKRNGRLPTSATAMINATSESEHTPAQQRASRASARKPTDKLALDYELFTIGGSGKSVQPHEALSMKKSVEAAAIFADVKLSQTTDIKTLCPPALPQTNLLNGHKAQGQVKDIKAHDKLAALKNIKNYGSCRSYSSSSAVSKKQVSQTFSKRRESYSIERKNEHNILAETLSTTASHKSSSADDLLSKLSAIEKAASVKSGRSSKRIYASKEHFNSNYQSMRAVSASLEDTLGYLP